MTGWRRRLGATTPVVAHQLSQSPHQPGSGARTRSQQVWNLVSEAGAVVFGVQETCINRPSVPQDERGSRAILIAYSSPQSTSCYSNHSEISVIRIAQRCILNRTLLSHSRAYFQHDATVT